MGKLPCILHANCQGEPLLARLMTSREFADRFECVQYTNYTRDPVPDEMLARCGLFLYQHLGPEWGGLASERLVSRLPASARSLCIPNMFFKGYWPGWSGQGGFNFRCTLLDELIAQGLSPEETTLVYLRADLAAKFDLPAVIAQSLAQERSKQALTPVPYVDVLEAEYARSRIFNTVNHPGRLLMDHAARGVLRLLGLEAPDEDALAALDEPFPEFEQPVHPSVAAFFGWDSAAPGALWHVFGRDITFARYVAHYVVARREGVTDFIGFLQGHHDAP